MIYQMGVHWAAKDIDPLKSVIIDGASPSVRSPNDIDSLSG